MKGLGKGRFKLYFKVMLCTAWLLAYQKVNIQKLVYIL